MSRADEREYDAVAIPPAPNWYGSSLADWGGGGDVYAYAARNAIVLLRPRHGHAAAAGIGSGKGGGGGGGGDGGGGGEDVGSSAARATHATPTSAAFAGTLVGHSNRVTALAFARCGGVTHLLVSGSADKALRLWDTASRRCVKVLKGHTAEVSALATSPVAADLCVSGDRTGRGRADVARHVIGCRFN